MFQRFRKRRMTPQEYLVSQLEPEIKAIANGRLSDDECHKIAVDGINLMPPTMHRSMKGYAETLLYDML